MSGIAGNRPPVCCGTVRRCCRTRAIDSRPYQLLLSPHLMEVGVAEIFLSEGIVGIEPGSRAKFFDRPVPVVPERIGMAEIIVRPGFVRRLVNRVGPEQDLVTIEYVPLVREEAEQQD